MFDNASLGPDILRNPGMIQNLVLTEIVNRLNGTIVLPDPNSAVNNVLEFGSSMTAQMVRQEDDKLSSIFRQRVSSVKDVYSFLSDYDVATVMAAPASLNVRLLLSAQWIINNAVSYDANYNKLQIPATTTFTLGSLTFGLYYPIDILVSKTTNGMSILYNTDSANPLFSLTDNSLTDVNFFTQAGIDMVSLIFPVYQFVTTPYVESISTKTGWTKTYSYTDQFYAINITAYVNGVLVTLPYTLSSFAYDPTTPTALLTIESDRNLVTVEIPQVYFTRGLMGSQVNVSILTTSGALNTTISASDAADMMVNFDQSANQYSGPWTQVPVISILPYNQSTIAGGADAMSYDALRTAVSDGSLYDGAIITRMDMALAATKLGFKLTRYIDNLDRRIYFADAQLTSSSGATIPCVYSNIILDSTALSGDPSTIIKSSSDSLYTILPTTLFSYNTATDTSTVVNNATTASIAAMTNDQVAALLNASYYTRQPFHIVVDTSSTPQARAYNMMTPAMTGLSFIQEDAHIASQFSVSSVAISHDVNGTGGFTINLGAVLSAGMTNVDPSTLSIILMTTLRGSETIYLVANYVTMINGLAVYSAHIDTTYRITHDGYFTIRASGTDGSTVVDDLPLTATFDVRMVIPASLESGVTQSAVLAQGVPLTVQTNSLICAQQSLTIAFGTDLSTLVYNPVNTTWGPVSVVTYQADVPRTQATDMFLRDASGNLLTYDTGSAIELIRYAHKDDAVLSLAELSLTATANAPIGSNVISGTIGTYSQAPMTTPVAIGSFIDLGDGITRQITAITGSQYTLSSPTTVAMAVGAIATILPTGQLTYDVSRTITATATALTSLTLSSVADMFVGMTLYTFGYEGVITAINGNVVALTPAAGATALPQRGMPFVYALTTGSALLAHKAGDPVLDALGNSTPVTAQRSNVYAVKAVQFDAKLFASSAPDDVAYVKGLPLALSNKASTLSSIAQALENTDVYFRPYRTFGTASFDVGGGTLQTYDLDQSFTVTYYVPRATLMNDTLTALIRTSTATIVGAYLTRNIISSDDLAALLKSSFASNVTTVSVSGIDEFANLRVMAISTSGATPSLGRTLVVQADGSLATEPSVTVNFIQAPTVS